MYLSPLQRKCKKPSLAGLRFTVQNSETNNLCHIYPLTALSFTAAPPSVVTLPPRPTGK